MAPLDGLFKSLHNRARTILSKKAVQNEDPEVEYYAKMRSVVVDVVDSQVVKRALVTLENENVRNTLIALAVICVLVFLRIIQVLLRIRRRRRRSQMPEREEPIKTLIVLGSGGHTTEILMLTKDLDRKKYYPIEYCKASTDSTSIQRLNQPNAVVRDIPRSREVGQSYFTSIFTTLYAQMYAVLVVARFRPGLIICNGPGTCLPICLAALVFRILGVCEGHVVFVESYCRVQSLSLTGRLLYPWADLFVVHWKELHARYPNTKLVSTFVSQKQEDAKKQS